MKQFFHGRGNLFSGLFVLILIPIAFLNLATIRKKEDPILKTQTDPISVKQRLEELKDGEKEAPMPSWRLYPKSRFLLDPSTSKEQITVELPGAIPQIGDPIPEDEDAGWEEDFSSETKSKDEEVYDWWGEEAASESAKAAESAPSKDQ